MALTAQQAHAARQVLIRETASRPLTRKQRKAIKKILVATAMQRGGAAAAAGRAAESVLSAAITEKAVNKAVKRRLKETAKAGKQQIREALTAANAPRPAPGTGYAPAGTGEDGLLATMAAGRQSPFWRATAAVADTVTAPEAARPLHQMDADEFRAHAADALAAHGRANGFGGPAWADA